MYDFDEVIERRGTGSMKYDSGHIFHKPDGLMPLWVADMDFSVPERKRFLPVSSTGYSDIRSRLTHITRLSRDGSAIISILSRSAAG